MTGRARGACIAVSAAVLGGADALAQGASVGVPAGSWPTAAATFGTLALGAGALAALAVPAVRRAAMPALPRPTLSEEIPFLRIDDDGVTVICEDGVSFRVLEVDGLNHASLSRDQAATAARARDHMLALIGDLGGGVELTVLSERSRMPVKLASGGTNEWLADVNERWAAGFKKSFVNRHTIMVIDLTGGKLSQACTHVEDALERFGVRTLRHSADGASPLWSFLYRFVMGMGGPGWHGRGEDLPAELGDEADVKLSRALGDCPFEVLMVHRIVPMGVVGSSQALKNKKSNSFLLKVNRLQWQVFEDAETNLNAGEESYASYELRIIVFGDTPEAANEAAAAVKRLLVRHRAQGRTETGFVEEAFFDRFPRKNPLWLRKLMPRLKDVGELLPFEGTPRGLDGCWWGPASLRTMRTTSGVPYALGVHEHGREEALGNAVFIGKPGSGKTTMAAWLITGALSQFERARAFCFDNLDGLTVSTRAFGGRVIRPETDGAGGFALAPLQVDDTRENREFLHGFLLELAGVEDTAANGRLVDAGLDMMMQQPAATRTLGRFVREALPANSGVRDGLAAWVEGGAYGGWFDAERDSLDLEAARWITFDMQRVMNNPRLAAAMVAYVLHRIRIDVWRSPTPHIVFVDEAATLARSNPIFVSVMAMLAQNIRKKMGVVWFAFQEVGGMGDLREVVTNTTATQFFWRDPSAVAADYEDMNLSAADLRFIRDEDDGLRHLKRAFLAVRKLEAGRESVIIDGDLGGLGDRLNLFRSGGDAAELFMRCMKEYGEGRCVGPYLAQMAALD